jgi:hypothetical protein
MWGVQQSPWRLTCAVHGVFSPSPWRLTCYVLHRVFSPSAVATGNTGSNDVLDMPVDPNEPTYCLCHQVSFGEMIGCDNIDVS